MTMGIVIRDPITGGKRLDITDYTTQIYFSQVMTVAGDGSLYVPGINATDFCAFMIPCFAFGYPTTRIDEFYATGPAAMQKVNILGSVVSWAVAPGHLAKPWQLLVVRYQ